jgi:hypothetical protein
MIKNYMLTTPNIVLAYAGIPLAFAGLVDILNTDKSRSDGVAKIIIGLLILFAGDISYGMVFLWGGSVYIFIQQLSHKLKLFNKQIINRFIYVFLLFVAFSQLFLSGLIVGIINIDYTNYINRSYTDGLIRDLPRTADMISTLKFSTGQDEARTNLDIVSSFLSLFVILIGFILRKEDKRYLSLIVVGAFGLLMSAGDNIPYYQVFYKIFYSIPSTGLVRNMFKFGFLYVYIVFIFSAILIEELFKLKDRIFSILLVATILIPILNSTFNFFNTGKGRFVFIDMPNEYKELKDSLPEDENYRVFFYPLKDPMTTESYAWNNGYGVSQPYISSLLAKPDNIDTVVNFHSFNINLILKEGGKSELRNLDDFLKALGVMSFRYFIIRNDLSPNLYNEDAKNMMIKIHNMFNESGYEPILKNNYFEVYEIPSNYFIPIISSNDYQLVSSARGYNKNLLENKTSSTEKFLKINIKKERKKWTIRSPLFDNKLGLMMLNIDPYLFGKSVKQRSEVCNYKAYSVPASTNEIGNCLFIADQSRYILVEFFPDILNRYVKISGVILGLILIKYYDAFYQCIAFRLKNLLNR